MTSKVNTLAVALARRKVTSAAALRHRPRALPRPDEPRAIMRSYTSHLTGLVDVMHAETVKALAEEGLHLDAADGDPPLSPPQRKNILARLQAFAKRLVGEKKIVSALEGVSSAVTTFTREQFRAQVKAGLGIDLTTDPDLRAAMSGFRTANVSLIKSLVTEQVSRVRAILNEAGSGTRVESIAKQIQEATGVCKSRAALIARDQVLSLNGDMAQKRHEAAGITEYIWSTSRDERVRPFHRELEGTRQKYAEPPVVDAKGRRANAGRDFQCRCTCEPLLPEIDDLVESLTPEQRKAAFPSGEAVTKAKAATGGGKGGGSGPDWSAEIKKAKATPAEKFAPPAIDPEEPPVASPAVGSPSASDKVLPSPPKPARKPYEDFGAMPIQKHLNGATLDDHAEYQEKHYPGNDYSNDYFFKLGRETKAAKAAMGPDLHEALRDYTGNEYAEINNALRSGKASKEIAAKTARVNAALAHLPKVDSGHVLFRGLTVKTEAALNELAGAGELSSKSFTSTSRSPSTALAFGAEAGKDEFSVLYRIHKPKSGVLVEQVSQMGHEKEVLFPPGARFRVIGRQRTAHNQLVLDMEEIE